MKIILFWIATGGISFWLLPIAYGVVSDPNANWLATNVLSLVGLALFALVTWTATKRFPRWGWVLAGIYILGPVSMLAPSAVVHNPSSANVPSGWIWLLLFCLFPPMTLWMALLNGMIFSVLIATVVLPFLAVYQRRHSATLGVSQIGS